MQERHVPFRATAFVGAAAVLWGATFPIGKAALASVDVPMPHVVVLGVLGSGIAYTVQALGQRDLTPQRSAVVISLEAVVSAVIGVAWLDETMRWHQWLGAAAIVSAIAVGSSARSRSASPQG